MAPFSVRTPPLFHLYRLTIFQRLVRFLAKNGRTYYGDAILPHGVTDIAKAKQAKIIHGPVFGKHDVTEEVADIRLLLAPLALEDVKTVRCLGLNYEQHAIEVRKTQELTREAKAVAVEHANSEVSSFVCMGIFSGSIIVY